MSDGNRLRPPSTISSGTPNLASATALSITSHLVDAPLLHITITPDDAPCLRAPSQAMVDKITAIKRERIGNIVGHLDKTKMIEVNVRSRF